MSSTGFLLNFQLKIPSKIVFLLFHENFSQLQLKLFALYKSFGKFENIYLEKILQEINQENQHLI